LKEPLQNKLHIIFNHCDSIKSTTTRFSFYILRLILWSPLNLKRHLL